MVYRRQRPPLSRLARYLRWCSALAAVGVVLFLLSTVVSGVEFASGLAVTTPPGGAYAFNTTAQGEFVADFAVNLTNAGIYPAVLDLTTVARTPQGLLVPYSTTGAVTFAPGGRSTRFGISVVIPETTLQADGARLLLDNTTISGDVWLNGSYAWIYQIGFTVVLNGTWGAPFSNLTVKPGTPTIAEGQTTVSATIDYRNNAFFAVGGNLTFQVVDGGTDCGPPVNLPVDTPSDTNFTGELNLTGPTSCMVPGAEVDASYTLGTLNIPLPPSRLE